MTPQIFLLILRAHYKTIAFILILTILTALIITLNIEKQYTASTAVVIDVRSPDPVAGLVLPGMIAPSYMATQLDIINSDRVTQRVIKLLKLDKDSVFHERWLEAVDGKGDINNWLVVVLEKSLDVKPSKESNVINIAFTDPSSKSAANIADAFARAYINVNLELKVDPARQYADWFEGQTKTLRDQLEKAQQRLTAYQENKNILAVDEQRVDYEKARLGELSQQLTIVQAQTSESSSKRQSGSGSDTLLDVMQSPVIMSLKSEINRLEAKLQDINVNLGQNHPQTQRAESELASLRETLALETKKISRSIDMTYQVSKQKEKELMQAIEVQKKRLIDLSQQQDEITVLRREVESAQRAFETVGNRSTQTRLESQSIQTNISILTPAVEPTSFSKPRMLINMVAAFIVGSLLSLSTALGLEFLHRRVRSSGDLSTATNLPVLAAMSAVQMV